MVSKARCDIAGWYLLRFVADLILGLSWNESLSSSFHASFVSFIFQSWLWFVWQSSRIMLYDNQLLALSQRTWQRQTHNRDHAPPGKPQIWSSWFHVFRSHFVIPHLPGEGCSPHARWGLLDFMSVDFRLLPLSASSGPQLRPSTPSVPCRTSIARIHAKCSLPDLNRENPRQVFPAGPQPRESTPMCSLPDLNRRRECQKICQIECQIERQIECQIECQRRMPDKNAR